MRSCSASPLFRIFEIFGIFTKLFTLRILSELASSDRFPSMSDPALPPNPSGGPSTTSTNPFAPLSSLAPVGRGILFGPPRPPPNPAAAPFVSAQKRLRSDTISPRPTIKEEIIRKFPRCDYWTLRMAQAIDERGQDPMELCSSDNPERFVLSFLSEMQKEFTN
jgi:hypothetical protein